MTEETRQYMEAMKDTKIQWTEEELLDQLSDMEYAQEWVKIMLAGVLGSVDAAQTKYPELYI